MVCVLFVGLPLTSGTALDLHLEDVLDVVLDAVAWGEPGGWGPDKLCGC